MNRQESHTEKIDIFTSFCVKSLKLRKIAMKDYCFWYADVHRYIREHAADGFPGIAGPYAGDIHHNEQEEKYTDKHGDVEKTTEEEPV